MVKLELAHRDVILAILDYCQEMGLVSTMLTLEQETDISLFKYSQEIQFLRQLVLEGNWAQVENLLKAISRKGKFDINRGIFCIKKQTYLELLAGPAIDRSNLQYVVQELQPYCDEEVFHQLCMLLTLPRLCDHSLYAEWTIEKGRLACFQQIRHLFAHIY
jgi:hypothetical protein